MIHQRALPAPPFASVVPALESAGSSDHQAPFTNAEWVQLRVRVIALENLVIALLADGPDRQRALVREMATYITPRTGFTPHPVTLRAAEEMLSLVDRAGRYSGPWQP